MIKSLSSLTHLSDLTIRRLWYVKNGGLEFPIINSLSSLVIDNMSLNENGALLMMKSLPNVTCLSNLTICNLWHVKEGDLEFPPMNRLTSLVLEKLQLNNNGATAMTNSLFD